MSIYIITKEETMFGRKNSKEKIEAARLQKERNLAILRAEYRREIAKGLK